MPDFFGSGNGANARQNSLYNSLFLRNTCFTREKTVHFRELRKSAKKRDLHLVPDPDAVRSAMAAGK
jgi:hypothetical protein